MEQKRIEEIHNAIDYTPANLRDEDMQDIIAECLAEIERLQKALDEAETAAGIWCAKAKHLEFCLED